MRQGSNPKGRSRGRGGSGGGGSGGGSVNGGGGLSNKKPNPVRVGSFDNGSPPARVRGNAHQMMDKYLSLARDASSQGDRVLAEHYFQHADHYYRIMGSMPQPNGRGPRGPGGQTPAQPGGELDASGGEGGAVADEGGPAEDSGGSDGDGRPGVIPV
ncbi:MAG: DUF4167 domain-containing protein [Alphaproteobacteria bacterium]